MSSWGRVRYGCLLCLMLAGSVARAAVSYDPALTWQTLTTAHFRVHFHDGEEALARRTAAMAEQVHRRLVSRLGWTPDDAVDIVLSDRVDVANGAASVFPYDQMTIFVTPPDEVDGLEDHGGWLETVLTHEYTHILHLDRAEGAPAMLRRIFGRNVLLFPNALEPSWFIEGLATWIESDRTRGIGRAESSYFDMLMRMEVAHGIKPLRQINQPLATWPGGQTPYLYGVEFYDFVAHDYGEPKIRQWVDKYSSNLIPFRINGNAKKVFGGSLDDVWPKFDAYLRARHDPVLKTIRAAGVVAGERLTNDGYDTGGGHALPDGGFVYLRANGRDETSLWRRYPDGRARFLVRTSAMAHFTVDPKAGILLAQPDLDKSTNFYFDLYQINLDGGPLRRLTETGRYRYGAWSPDGSRIVAVHNGGGIQALHLLDADGHLLEVLWPGEPDVEIADPAWAPDGESIVMAVWRPQSRWNLERFGLRDRRFEMLTLDPAVKAQPHFTADGKAILFSSDHGGVYNLRRLDLASRAITTLTNVEGGAFHPTQATVGGPIIYTGYTADGFDIFRLDPSRELKTPPAPQRPLSVATPEPEVPGDLQVSDYSPYPGLRPRWWFPTLWIDSQRTELGVMTSGWDPLFRHTYYVNAAYDVRNDWFTGSVDYLYDRYWPTLKLHASRYNSLYLDQNKDPAWISNEDTYMGEAVLPFRHYRYSVNVHAAAYMARDSIGWAAAGVVPTPDRTDNVLGYALVYDSTWRYPLSISRSHGVQLSVAAETSDALSGSNYSGEVYTADGRAFLPLGGEHVLALRAAYGWGTKNPRPFLVGGSDSGTEEPLPLDTAVVNSPFNRRHVALRGYDSGLPGLTGRRMAIGSAEWRFPLTRVERGYMAPPIGLHQLSGALFAETGDAWQDGHHPDALATDAGAEVHADVVLFYDLAMHVRLGYAYGFADNGGSHVYLQLGSSF